MRQHEGHDTPQDYCLVGKGAYCGLSTTSEVFLISTTQLYSFPCTCDAFMHTMNGKKGGLQREYSQPLTFPSPNSQWVLTLLNHISL